MTFPESNPTDGVNAEGRRWFYRAGLSQMVIIDRNGLQLKQATGFTPFITAPVTVTLKFHSNVASNHVEVWQLSRATVGAVPQFATDVKGRAI